jgi:hypothetical protein
MTTPHIEKMRKQSVERIEKNRNLERYINQTSEGLKVNWKNLLEDHHTFLSNSSCDVEDRNYCDILDYLQIKGVLTHEGKPGSFFVRGCGMDISPMAGMVKYNFSREEDARIFVKEEYKNTQYNVSIAKNLK